MVKYGVYRCKVRIFKMEKQRVRASGVLMHISSLPSESGIGTLGKSAYAFVDFLKGAGQRYWQILPVCPTGFGASPYQSYSSFAGNPFFIDLELLCRSGFLKKEDYEGINWGEDASQVDFERVEEGREKVFKKVFANFKVRIPDDFYRFCEKSAVWLDDYALFMAVKDAHGGAAFGEWEDSIRRRDKAALALWKEQEKDRILYHKMLQYFFFKQWTALKKYAGSKGIHIIGDLPIYVSADSADVWANPKQFLLDSDFKPIEVAGCPPDAFSEEGQLWGNPVYNWKYMRRDKFKFWIRRLKMSLCTYDIVRIDHFRGFEAYYCIPYGAENAKIGVWRKGPGMELFNAFKKALGDLPIIAEDLGFLTDGVKKLLSESGFPGMKVLQFAFDGGESDYMPHNHTKNSVVYTGTHDNDTLNGWIASSSGESIERAMRYLAAASPAALREKMMIAALASVADTAILTMQDLIGLSSEARMNTPSTLGVNWKWRALPEQINSAASGFLLYYTQLYHRMNPLREEV